MSIHDNNEEPPQRNNDEDITKRRLALKRKSYLPLPVNGKSPVLKSWTDLTTQHSDDDIVGWVERYPYALSTGVIHDGVVMCLDLDCKDLDLMRVLHAIVIAYLPGARVRIGESPKAAYFFGAVTDLVDLPTSVPLRWETGEGQKAQIEVRGMGGQTVVDGIHPVTGEPYRWPHGDLPPVDELPQCDDTRMHSLIGELRAAVDAHYGANNVAWGKSHVTQPHKHGSASTSALGVTASIDFVALLLSGLDNATLDLDWDGWFSRVLLPVKGALKHEPDGGYALFEAWSEPSDAHTIDGCRRAWDSFVPHGLVGVATLIRTVKALGEWTQTMQTEHERVLEQLKPAAVDEFEPITDADYPADYSPAMLPARQSLALAAQLALADVWGHSLDDGEPLRPRQWLYGYCLMASSTWLLAGKGGSGKTMLALQEALSLASGRSLLGPKVWFENGVGVVHLNRDDTQDELRRRYRAVCQHYQIDRRALAKLLLVGSDVVPADFTLMREETGGPVVCQTSIDWLCDGLLRRDAKVLQLDPLTRFCTGETGAHARVFHAALSQVQQRTGAAVLAVHHRRKGEPGEDADAGDVADSMRGSSAFIDLARGGRVAQRMNEKQASREGVNEDLRAYLVGLRDAKANYSLAGVGLIWNRLVPVDIGNPLPPWPGDSVGVLEPWSPDPVAGLSDDECEALFDAIAQREKTGVDFWSTHPQSGAERSMDSLALLLNLEAGAVKRQVDQWLKSDPPVLTDEAPWKDSGYHWRKGLGVLRRAELDPFA